MPSFVKSSTSINSFKNNLSKFKNTNFNQVGNYWELSNEIFRRIPEIDRDRGDLIETFKILSGFTKYGENLFRLSRSGEKLISRPGDEFSFKHAFFARRVIYYWNSYLSLKK